MGAILAHHMWRSHDSLPSPNGIERFSRMRRPLCHTPIWNRRGRRLSLDKLLRRWQRKHYRGWRKDPGKIETVLRESVKKEGSWWREGSRDRARCSKQIQEPLTKSKESPSPTNNIWRSKTSSEEEQERKSKHLGVKKCKIFILFIKNIFGIWFVARL